MASPRLEHVLIVGAGASGLMAGRELARAGKKVTILEARLRCGGRIDPLPAQEFGYAAEGGAEFIHGAAPVTRALARAAGLAVTPVAGTRRHIYRGVALADEAPPDADRVHRALADLRQDMPIAAFLDEYFPGPRYSALRVSVIRMVEGYDAADPQCASTFALRDEWMEEGLGQQDRLADGYGALIDWLARACRESGASIHCGAGVAAIEDDRGRVTARCYDGTAFDADAVVLTVPLPLLATIALPAAARAKAAVAAGIGFGNVVKILLRFETEWWADKADCADLSFLLAPTKVPTWWTQRPARHPVLTGWFAGPKTATMAQLSTDALIALGLASLAEIFAVPQARLETMLLAARAIDWGNDPFARGAYSYATPQTRAAQAAMQQRDAGAIFFSGEALYAGHDMGTVEAALASGRDTANIIAAIAP